MARRMSIFVVMAGLLLTACGSSQQPRGYVSELSSDDSLTIRMGKWDLTRFHSEKLGIDINYPSFLFYQELPSELSQEVFIYEDVSLSVIVDSLNGMGYSAGQQMMSMGADLLESTDRYSIQTGQDDKWEYFGKVIDVDTTRVITVMLRYYPDHGEAVEPLREWVKAFDVE